MSQDSQYTKTEYGMISLSEQVTVNIAWLTLIKHMVQFKVSDIKAFTYFGKYDWDCLMISTQNKTSQK